MQGLFACWRNSRSSSPNHDQPRMNFVVINTKLSVNKPGAYILLSCILENIFAGRFISLPAMQQPDWAIQVYAKQFFGS